MIIQPWIFDMMVSLGLCEGPARRIIASYASMTGLSEAQVYRIANKYGWKSGKKRRKKNVE